jgi:hypothetical protein
MRSTAKAACSVSLVEVRYKRFYALYPRTTSLYLLLNIEEIPPGEPKVHGSPTMFGPSPFPA